MKEHQFGYGEADESGWFDRALKKIMPNGTVMRRYIAILFIAWIVSGTVAIRLINRTDSQSTRGTKAICAVKIYAEDTLDDLPASPTARPQALERFKKLVKDMRATGVECRRTDNR